MRNLPGRTDTRRYFPGRKDTWRRREEAGGRPGWYRAATRNTVCGRPGWYRAAGGLAATAALAGVALAVTAAGAPAARGHAATAEPTRGPAPSASLATPAAARPAAHGTVPLRLAPGTHPAGGLDLGYPHSAAGAVSAAVEFVTELGSTLDPDRAAAVARLTADPSWPGAPQAAARGVAGTRRRLGLPASGPLPPGTAVSLVPAMYQLRDETPAHVTVLLLFDYTAMVPRGISEHLGATAATLHWTSAGWKLLAPAGPDASGLIATPGTA